MADAIVRPPRRFLDLGSGGGVPGLALLDRWRSSEAVLLDARQRRAAFLGQAVDDLGFRGRAEVLGERAEVAARDPARREHFDLVVARSFAGPAVTAECGVGFLEPGGVLLVADPPDAGPDRWPADSLAELGLVADPATTGGPSLTRLRLPGRVADRWPRRAPAKRPLWV